MLHLVRNALFKHELFFMFFCVVMLKLLSPFERPTFPVRPLVNPPHSSPPILPPKPTKCFRSLRCSARKTLDRIQTQVMTDADENILAATGTETYQTRHTLRQRLFQSVGAFFRLRRQVLESSFPTTTANQAHTLPTIVHSIPSVHLVQWWNSSLRDSVHFMINFGNKLGD